MGYIKKALHTGISVKNMEESVKWYAENLEFDVVSKDMGFVPPLGAKIVFVKNEALDYEIELFEYQDPKPLPEDRLTPNTDLQTIGTKHLALEIDGFDELHDKLVKNGVDIAHEVKMDGDAVMFIRDCNGVLIELIQPPKAE